MKKIFTYCIRLPYLHAELSKDLMPNALNVWPGHSPLEDDSHYWQPDDLPLPAEMIAHMLNDIENADFNELDRLRRLLASQASPSKLHREQQEISDLNNFCKNGEHNPGQENSPAIQRRCAHLFLLWTWLQEKKLLELAELEKSCANISDRLLNCLWEDCEVWDIPQTAPAKLNLSALPDWRSLCAHALVLIPPQLPILAEAPMASEILAESNWSPLHELSEEAAGLPAGLLATYASFKELSGMKTSGSMSDACHAKRLWLLRENA